MSLWGRLCKAGCGYFVYGTNRVCKPCREASRLAKRERAGLCRYSGTCRLACSGGCDLERLERAAEGA